MDPAGTLLMWTGLPSWAAFLRILVVLKSHRCYLSSDVAQVVAVRSDQGLCRVVIPNIAQRIYDE